MIFFPPRLTLIYLQSCSFVAALEIRGPFLHRHFWFISLGKRMRKVISVRSSVPPSICSDNHLTDRPCVLSLGACVCGYEGPRNPQTWFLAVRTQSQEQEPHTWTHQLTLQGLLCGRALPRGGAPAWRRCLGGSGGESAASETCLLSLEIRCPLRGCAGHSVEGTHGGAWEGHVAVGRSVSNCFPPEIVACRVGVKLDSPLVPEVLDEWSGTVRMGGPATPL